MYHHILVPLDGSALAETVLPQVKDLARSTQQVRITLLRAVPPVPLSGMEFNGAYSGAMPPLHELEQHEQQAHQYLHDLATHMRAEGFEVSPALSRLQAAEAVLAYAENHSVDLIAMATHGRSGLSRWMFGSVTQKVIQVSPVPVLVIRPDVIKEKQQGSGFSPVEKTP